MIANSLPPTTTKHAIFLHPEKYNSFSFEQKYVLFKEWVLSTIVFKIKLPNTFILAPETKIKDKKKTEKVLLSLLKFISNFSYPPYNKLALELALTKEQEFGNFLDLQKLSGSKFYFAKKEEELDEDLLVGESTLTLIIKDFQIQDIPEDTIIFTDSIPTEIPFILAQKGVLKNVRAGFENNLNAAIKEKGGKEKDISKEEKEAMFQNWLRGVYEEIIDKELQEYFASMIDYEKK